MSNVTYIVPRSFGKVSDLRDRFPNHSARADSKRGVVLMLPRVAANQEQPRRA